MIFFERTKISIYFVTKIKKIKKLLLISVNNMLESKYSIHNGVNK
jgi:hypothetical protein